MRYCVHIPPDLWFTVPMTPMTRVKIDLPDTWLFRIDLPVRITDINYGNHLGNDALVGLLQEARVRWLNQFGWTELIEGQLGLIQVDLAVRFKNEARFGDILTVSIQPDNWSRRGFDLMYRVANREGSDVAHARSGFLFFDYGRGKVAALPDGFQARVTGA